MSSTPSAQVLRGSVGTALRHEDDALVLERPGEELTIPRRAVAAMRADGRSVAVELRSPAGTPATVYRIEDVSEAAATAFADAVNDTLPDHAEELDGAALVTTRTLTARTAPRWRSLAIGVAVSLLALDVFLGVAGGARSAGMLWPALLPIAAGGIMVFFLGRDLYRMWHLPRHGITVVAEFSHHTNRTRIYRYTDTTGTTHTYDHNVGGASVEVSYDPRDPKVAIHRDGLYLRGMMALMTLAGCGLAGGGLYGIGWLVVDALGR